MKRALWNLLLIAMLLTSGCGRRGGMLDPPRLAVGEVLLAIDHQERLTRQERVAQSAEPLDTVVVGHYRIERRSDGMAHLQLDDEHVLPLGQVTDVQLADRLGHPLGMLPDVLANHLNRPNTPARHQAANVAAYLLGRSIIPFTAETPTQRIFGRFRLSEQGRRTLLNAVAEYYATLRGLDP